MNTSMRKQWPRRGDQEAIIGVLLAVLITLFILTKQRRRRAARTAPLPPGPLGVPLLGSLPFLRSDLHVYFKELAGVYGPVLSLRLGRKLYVHLSSPETVKEMYKDQDAVFANHDVPIVATVAFYGGRDIVWSPYGPYWRDIRKTTVRELLNPATIAGLSHLRTAEIRRMTDKVGEMAGQPVDLRELVSNTTMNMMTEMLWGGSANDVGEEKEVLEREFCHALISLVEPLGVPNISDFFPALAFLDLQGLARRSRKHAALVDAILNQIIERRKRSTMTVGEKNSGKDFLQVMLELLEMPGREVSLTLDGIKAIILDLLIGGIDTTTTMVEWTLTELVEHPEKLKKVSEEIDIIVGQDNSVEEAHLPSLKYLDAVIKETLRLHPPLPFMLPRCPSSESRISGYRIPEGTRVFINMWAIQRDPKLWDKPLSFNPERFLDEESKMYSVNNFSYLPFGSGRRVCVGVKLAQRMLKLIIASLLHSAEWTVPQGELSEWSVKDKFESILKKEKPLVLVPIKNSSA